MKVKTILQIILLLIFLSFIFHYLITNKNGFFTSLHLNQEVLKEKKEIADLEQEVAQLENTSEAWKNSSFEKERLAREDLMMSHTHEYVYLIPSSLE